ncbi:MAG: DNA gyrase subunit A [Candidatus Campbellbacteria bacterium]|nr:DNA gyrase subunit A [Candidatus Campbellbacteria bacterium]
MASKTPKEDENIVPDRSESGIVSRSISAEMKEAYLDYAMSVITMRALPDVRDGLKPVHRRILYAMYGMRLLPTAKPRKSAAVVGEVLGKYHPHGDASVYDAMVNMAQLFSYRYPLVIGQGNFGSIDGDPPAAMRYTEARMSRVAFELMQDLEKDTVDWRPNYDGRYKEPVVFPASVPGLLLNGTLGIAVGMATNIPPHNLREVVHATVHLADNPEATNDDLLSFVKGPDFPTGGVIFGEKDIKHAYTNGKGGIVTRGEAEIMEGKKGQFQIIITSIPYRVNKADLIVKVADLVREKKIDGIRDIRDESTKDIRVVIELKTGAHPQKILNFLYKHTQLEDTFHINTVCLVDGVPQTLSLKSILEEFVKHRLIVVRRRTQFDLNVAQAREHILLGLSKALDHIDQVIAVIKKSKDALDAKESLKKKFSFSELQAIAILEMRLQKLAGLERKKVEDELAEVQKTITELTALLKSEKKMREVIKTELTAIEQKYGDDRRTKVVRGGVENLSAEDLIPNEENVVVFTAGGYIKRTNPSEYKAQKRGGVGVIDLDTKEEDFVTMLVGAHTHDDLLFFTDKGKVYQLKMYELPEGKRATKGKSVMNFLQLSDGERVTSILPLSKISKESKGGVMMVTRRGVAKKVAVANFHDVRRSGIIAISLDANDELIAAVLVNPGDETLLVSQSGQSIRFKETDIRAMGRTAGGVRAMRLSAKDVIVGTSVVKKEDADSALLILLSNGYGKRTAIDEYKTQKRGGGGVKTANVTAKTGKVMASQIVSSEEGELVVISQKGQVIRVALSEISLLGRVTQGVRIMKLREGDSIASFVCL